MRGLGDMGLLILNYLRLSPNDNFHWITDVITLWGYKGPEFHAAICLSCGES